MKILMEPTHPSVMLRNNPNLVPLLFIRKRSSFFVSKFYHVSNVFLLFNLNNKIIFYSFHCFEYFVSQKTEMSHPINLVAILANYYLANFKFEIVMQCVYDIELQTKRELHNN